MNREFKTLEALLENKDISEVLINKISESLKKNIDNTDIKNYYQKRTSQWLEEYKILALKSYYLPENMTLFDKKNRDAIEARSKIFILLAQGLNILEEMRKQILDENILYLTISIKEIPFLKRGKNGEAVNVCDSKKDIDNYFNSFIDMNKAKNNNIKLYIIKDIDDYLINNEASKTSQQKKKKLKGSPQFRLNKSKIVEDGKKSKKAYETIYNLQELSIKVEEKRKQFISDDIENTFFTYYSTKQKTGVLVSSMSNRKRYLQWLQLLSAPAESGEKFYYKKIEDSIEREVESWKKIKGIIWKAYSKIYKKEYAFHIGPGQIFESYLHAMDFEDNKKNWNLDDAFIASSNNLPFFKGPDSVYTIIKNESSIKQQILFQQKILENASISGKTILNGIILLNSILTGENWLEKDENKNIPDVNYRPIKEYSYGFYVGQKKISLEQQLAAFFTDYIS